MAGALAAQGVRVAFGLPGVHNLPLWPACTRAGVPIVGARHEQGAAYAADGLARTTGHVGVALVTTGPGAANTLAAVGEAWTSHSPVVIVATDVSRAHRQPGVYRGALHESLDQAAMFRPVVKATLEVAEPEAVGPAVQAAITIAATPPAGPVYVGIPHDLLRAPCPAVALMPPAPRAATAAEVEPLLAAIRSARRPLVWVGGGAKDASGAIGALASRLGAPVLTTFQGRGVLPAGHPCLVGAPPHEPVVIDLVRRADLVVVIGSDLDATNTMAWQLPLPERRVAINLDPEDAAKSYPMDAVVAADATFAGVLAESFAPREPWVDAPAVGAAVRAELRSQPETRPAVDFLEATESALPESTVLFADMCIPGYWLAGYVAVHRARSLHYPVGWGTLGFAFPASIGAASALRAAADERPVVSFNGDGGTLLALGELAVVAQERLPLVIVVVDDGGYGMLRYGHHDEQIGSTLHTPDFAAVARGFGVEAVSVDGLSDDYGKALAAAIAAGEPRLLHVRARFVPPRTTSPRWPLRGGS